MGKLGVEFLLHLTTDILFTFILIRFLYYPLYKIRERIFIYISFNIILFLLMWTMNSIDVSTGSAFGIFAIFSILRYRTELISPRDLTYLFMVIAMALLNAVVSTSWTVLLSVNLLLLCMTWLIEGSLIRDKKRYIMVKYDHPDQLNSPDLVAVYRDLEQRTGRSIDHVSIGKIDYINESVQLTVYYHER